MRSLHPGIALALLTVALGGGALRIAAADFRLFRNTWGDVLVATDMVEAGRKLPPASPANPVYYQGLSLGRRLGSIPGDDEPTVKELNAVVADILAKQGYLGTQRGVHEPTLLLVLQWGYLKPGTDDLLWFLGYHEDQDIAAPTQINFLGAEVFRRNLRSREIETILEDAQHPIYGILISAFEYETAKTLNPVILWQTRIGLPANGKSMAEALPVMIAAGGPAIGRPSDKPVMLDADAIREGKVNLGELKFLGEFYDPYSGLKDGTKK